MKKLISFLISLALVCSFCTVFVSAESTPITLSINGTAVECDVPPQMVEGQVLVPLRAILESADGKILTWDESTSTVHASVNGKIVSLQIGSTKLFISNDVLVMEIPPMIIGDRTMVSLFTIANCLGCDAVWNPDFNSVVITK